MGAQLQILGSVDQEVSNPRAGGGWEPQVGQLGDGNVMYYCVKG